MPRKIANEGCSCHPGQLAQHTCGACGQLGHHRPLCQLLEKTRQEQRDPCDFCPGKAHVSQHHYCQLCSSQPTKFYHDPDSKHLTIGWQLKTKSTLSSNDPLLASYRGHSHRQCPLLVDFQNPQSPNWIGLTSTDIMGNSYPNSIFIKHLTWILIHENQLKKDYPLSYNRRKHTGDQLLYRYQYWTNVPCSKIWWANLVLLMTDDWRQPIIRSRFLTLISLFLKRNDQGSDRKEYSEHCDCSRDLTNLVITKLVIHYLYQ